MPGTKKSGRPGGNPDIAEVGYKITDPDRTEAFTEHIALKVTPTVKAKLKTLGRSWAAFVRDAIDEKLATLD